MYIMDSNVQVQTWTQTTCVYSTQSLKQPLQSTGLSILEHSAWSVCWRASGQQALYK